MFELTKILCPVDLSRRSPEAARYAGALACHFHAELHLVHVVSPRSAWVAPDIGPPVVGDLLEIERDNAQRCLTELLPERSKDVRRTVLDGDAAYEIVEYANREKIHLIVMPTHGYGPFRRFILGSVTAKVLHDAQCPVLTGVHVETTAAEQDFGMARIVCAVDLGPDSERVLRWADRFARSFGSSLTAVNITRWEQWRSDPAEKTTLTGDALLELERLRDATGAYAEVFADTGEDIARKVCSTAEGLEANLTIIGRGGFGKSAGRLRANSYAIIRQSHCPVVSV